jgi:hypothetical protein
MNDATLFAPVLFGDNGQWFGATAMVGISNFYLFIATNHGLYSVYTCKLSFHFTTTHMYAYITCIPIQQSTAAVCMEICKL